MKKDRRIEKAVKGLSAILDAVKKAKKEAKPFSAEEFASFLEEIQKQAISAFIALAVRPEHLDQTLEALQAGKL